MSLINFDYFLTPYIKNKKLEAIYRPIIPIRCGGNHKIYPSTINCLVDSGADFILFPADIGEYFGYKIRSGNKITHIGIGNVGIIAYEHPIKLYIQGYSFNTNVHFSYDHKIPLLGRHSFFKYFKKLTFNENKLQLELLY